MTDQPPFPSTSGRRTDVVGNSVSCRLPHTPRTPSVGMAHYFDDTFHRHVNIGTPRRLSMPRTRRSSAAWSIIARSDFEGSTHYDDDDAGSVSRSWVLEDPSGERARQRSEADDHMRLYVSDQLERFRGEK